MADKYTYIPHVRLGMYAETGDYHVRMAARISGTKDTYAKDAKRLNEENHDR